MRVDDLDGHERGAEEAAQPRAQAVTHIGLHLAMSVRRLP